MKGRNETEGRTSARLGKWTNRFICSAGFLLVIVGAAKVAGSFWGMPVLDVKDPIFGVPLGPLTLLAGVAELGAGIVCFGPCRRRLKLGLVAWLAGNLAVYRVGAAWVGWGMPCGCLGLVSVVLGISASAEFWITAAMLVYLAGGGCFLYWLHSRARGVVDAAQAA